MTATPKPAPVAERDTLAAADTTHTLGQRDRELVRLGISRLIDHYEKKLEKPAAEVHDLGIEATCRTMTARLMELRNRFQDPTPPKTQLDAFEPDTRPLHLRLADVGYDVALEAIEGWAELARENVAAWLDKLPGVDLDDEEPAPPSVLAGYERAERPGEES